MRPSSTTPRSLDRLGAAIAGFRVPVALSLSTLPLPPLFHTTGCQASPLDLELARSLAESRIRSACGS